MNINTQIERAEIALEILKGRSTNSEPKWECYMHGTWIDPLPNTNPLIAAQTFPIRLKPEAEESIVPEGFTPWSGGESPVAAGVRVEVMVRDGTRFTGTWFWWNHINSWDDIVAYRIVPVEPAQDQKPIKLGDVLRDNVTHMEFLVTGSSIASVQCGNTWFLRSQLHELFDVTYDQGLTWIPVSEASTQHQSFF